MPTRNINLTERFDRFIESEVKSGRYGNASEVVREGLRLMEQRRAEERAKLKWLRSAVKEGLDQLDGGLGIGFGSTRELNKHIDGLERVAAKRAVNEDIAWENEARGSCPISRRGKRHHPRALVEPGAVR